MGFSASEWGASDAPSSRRRPGTAPIEGGESAYRMVEHPELVAQRIVRYANFMGRENVIAGTDCGFATFAGSDEVHPSIIWAKFEALVQGAQLASKQLWGRT